MPTHWTSVSVRPLRARYAAFIDGQELHLTGTVTVCIERQSASVPAAPTDPRQPPALGHRSAPLAG